MGKAVLVLYPSGEDYQLDHEDLQTILDALGREKARALKIADDCTKWLGASVTNDLSDEATAQRVNREKALTWHSMLTRVINRLS